MARGDGRPKRSGAEPERPDGDQFAAWVYPSLLAMTRLARRLGPGDAGAGDADDIVQEALERAWRKWHQFDPERGTPTTWLLAITADRARAARRRHHVRRLRLADDRLALSAEAVPDRPTPDTDTDTDMDLDRSVTALPERQRLAIALHYYLDLSVAETAKVMGCSPGTVKSTLSDARARLRDTLGGDDD